MNTRPRLFIVFGFILILTLLFAACTPAVQTPPPSQFQSGGETATQATGGEVSTGGEVGTGGEAETGGESTTDNPQVGEDVPFPEGIYDTNTSSDGGQIVYKVGGESQDVVQYYQDILPGLGWEMVGQDTVIGNTALMSRENANGDRLSINMQYNPNAGFTVVTLVVTRKIKN